MKVLINGRQANLTPADIEKLNPHLAYYMDGSLAYRVKVLLNLKVYR